jgi:hypothetical protein
MKLLLAPSSLALLSLAACAAPRNLAGPGAYENAVAAARPASASALPDCRVALEPIDDPVGDGREWFRAEILGLAPPVVAYRFEVSPAGTYFEQWQDDTDGDGRPEPGPGALVWFAGPAGRYRLTVHPSCGPLLLGHSLLVVP